MIETMTPDGERNLRSFLKTLRKRIDPATEMLGDYRRLANKRGRTVSQEELAEAVGVSRVWYALLESEGSIRPSVPLLNRIADALNASPYERMTLFRLAIPTLQSGLAHDADVSFAGVSLLRAATTRLRSATSENEALTIAAECAAHWFDDAALIVSARRTASSAWEWHVAINRDAVPDDRFAPCLSDLPYLQERIAAPNGFHGFIHVRHAVGHTYSQFDREVLAAIADVASLALS